MTFKEFFCRHNDLEFLGNIYGDLIDEVSTYQHINRSAWKCTKCGKIIFKPIFGDLCHESYNDYLNRINSNKS